MYMKHMREGVLIMIAVDKICMGLGVFFFFLAVGIYYAHGMFYRTLNLCVDLQQGHTCIGDYRKVGRA